ncbi:hypothetical protein [Rhabdochromatium marinum]|uniref:hypothetical protein n=1 Tax=Rhabdochromatium marinum TaxID=48729 RepID=UPI001906D830|nr:hypothetical protein [Rhabdochromatium marinum]MBK1648879.1 hypothetical protein [Rhabdochromatium marinum]
MSESQTTSSRRRLRALRAIPDNDRTDEQWDELNELEIMFAPVNRLAPVSAATGRREGEPARARSSRSSANRPDGNRQTSAKQKATRQNANRASGKRANGNQSTAARAKDADATAAPGSPARRKPPRRPRKKPGTTDSGDGSGSASSSP